MLYQGLIFGEEISFRAVLATLWVDAVLGLVALNQIH
jgi:hypothetical protein